MKKLITPIILVILFTSFFGCSDNYFDVNTPSGSANEDQLRMADLIGPITKNTFDAQYFAERSLGNYAQQITGQGGAAAGATSLSGTWTTVYLGIFPEINSLLNKAENLNATHFGAVAKILTAVNLGLLTDCWDNIPYTEASQFGGNLSPAFDTQEVIYGNINTLLSQAITALEAPDTSGYPIVNDMIYAGDATKWLKLAYTLRARYTMHLTEINGVAAATAALADLQKGFTSNADDFQMIYDRLNPWTAREISARATGNDHDKIGDQLVSYMNGTSYPYTTITEDPRLNALFVKLTSTAPDILAPLTDPWRGFVSGGNGLSSDGQPGNVNFKAGGFHTQTNSPLVIITFAEAMFLKAEAEFLVNGGNAISIGTNANAYTAYMSGITANMDKLGVAPVDRDAYLADTSIDMGMANIMLQHIMKEKYIANFLNPEVFVDLRRYNFSTNVFKDIALPADNATSEFPGQWLVRAQYPASEEARNPVNVLANKKDPTVKVWWDQ